jgi:hypothetical protein
VCVPPSVQVGQSCTLTATGQDPDGDPLTYRWATPTGTLANPADRSTLWTAPQQEGTVPVTVTVNDGKGGTAQATVNIPVTRPPVRNYTFEDVHFDFDRHRPDRKRRGPRRAINRCAPTHARVQISATRATSARPSTTRAGDRRARKRCATTWSPRRDANRLTTIATARSAELRQRARGNPPPQPPRSPGRQSPAVGGRTNVHPSLPDWLFRARRGRRLALWQAVSQRIASLIGIAALIAVGLGIMLAVTASGPRRSPANRFPAGRANRHVARRLSLTRDSFRARLSPLRGAHFSRWHALWFYP